jgi:hypothetical protein
MDEEIIHETSTKQKKKIKIEECVKARMCMH